MIYLFAHFYTPVVSSKNLKKNKFKIWIFCKKFEIAFNEFNT